MHIRTPFPFETTHEDLRIPLPDRTPLYARAWRPIIDEPVPVPLEHLPDRRAHHLTDWTAARRGDDGTDWRCRGELAGRAGLVRRCDGNVGMSGMSGISRGGFDSLRITALAPEPLKAIVTVCCSDDRYDNDAHHMGGSVLAEEMHASASALLAFACRPPDPRYVGDA